jgi:hypothetical protein
VTRRCKTLVRSTNLARASYSAAETPASKENRMRDRSVVSAEAKLPVLRFFGICSGGESFRRPRCTPSRWSSLVAPVWPETSACSRVSGRQEGAGGLPFSSPSCMSSILEKRWATQIRRFVVSKATVGGLMEKRLAREKSVLQAGFAGQLWLCPTVGSVLTRATKRRPSLNTTASS